MNKDMKRLEEKIDRIEKMLQGLPYPLRNLLDVSIDFDFRLRPLYPTTTSQDIHIRNLETRIKSAIYQDIKAIENKIQDVIRYI